jgi:GntR family transcriptional repressor for pyruvate dehydrogenase complex
VRKTKRGRPRLRPARTRNDLWWSRPSRVHPPRRMTLSERVADQLRRGILLGDLKGGTRLESCRAMARDAHVSASVVREGLARLQGEGLVVIRHGVGVFVVSRGRRARMARAARRSADRREVLELRASLEPIAAGAAARRPTDARLLELRLLLGERDRARGSGHAQAFADADVEFHRAVFRASGNRLAAAAAALAGPVLARQLMTDAAALADDAHLQELHDRLIDAIEAGRASRARRAAQAIAAREGERTSRPP